MFGSGSIARIVVAGSDSIIAPVSNPLGTPLQDRVNASLAGASIVVLNDAIATGQPLNQVLGDTYAYVATVDIQATSDFATVQDAASVLSNAFYVATGYTPGSVSVISVNNQGTGNPSPSTVPGSGVGSIWDSITGAVSSLFGNIGQLGNVVVLAVVLGVGVIVFLAIEKPGNIKKLI